LDEDEERKTFYSNKAKSETKILEFHKEIEELAKQIKNM
jgi:hypothetical protein